MATYSAFLRKEGLDWTLAKNANKTIGVAPGQFNPDAGFGKVYWVDKNTGSDDSDGLSPANAFATVEQAITVSNAEVGNYNMNTIYINSQTYTETLTVYPKNCYIIGIGSKVRIGGVSTFATPGSNVYWNNIQFRQATAAPTVTLGGGMYYGGGFFNCVFDNSGGSSATYGIELATVTDFTIQNCRFKGNPVLPTGIHVTGNCVNLHILDNVIAATTNGILIDAAAQGYQNWICGNFIGRCATDPNSSSQMTYGIRLEKADGSNAYTLINNRIEAADAISFVTADTNSHNQCISNATVEAGTGVMEDPLT